MKRGVLQRSSVKALSRNIHLKGQARNITKNTRGLNICDGLPSCYDVTDNQTKTDPVIMNIRVWASFDVWEKSFLHNYPFSNTEKHH